MFKKILDARISQLWKLYETTGEIQHQGEKGLLRELFLRQVIESVLPIHFGVGSGVVVDRWGKQSKQTDLLIYDRRRLPPLLEQQGHGIYPIDSVLRVLEVKSILTRPALAQIKSAFWQVNPTNPDGLKMVHTGNLSSGRSYYPLCGVFAYSTNIANIPSAINKINGIGSGTSMLGIIKRGVFTSGGKVFMPGADVTEVTRQFITLFLHQLEASAASRKPYSLLEWIW